MKSVLGLFSKIAKGNQGETLVLESITKLLRNNDTKETNFFIIPKVQIEDGTTSREIDIVLLHPLFGLFIIEVKNWDKLIITDENNPFEQAKEYKNLLLTKIKDELGKIAINVEFRVIFPKLTYDDAKEFFLENKNLSAYKQHSFFKEDLETKENFKRFFSSLSPILPNKKEFLTVASLLVNKEKLKKNEDKIIPIISNDEILYFDHKQLSVLNGYTDGFRIIRGVAGTGKTIILSHFINNKVNNGEVEKFLILCFNKRLVENINTIFENNIHKSSINIHSLFAFLNLIKFDFEKCRINNDTSFEEKYRIFETDIALEEFSFKFSEYLKINPIDYFICDETQDMPAGFMRIIYEKIKDCIFFIDEAQKVLHKDYLPQVDVCRESRFEYIFATQDEILLKNKLGSNKFEELYVNIVSKYSFETNSNNLNNKFEYIDLNTNRKSIANPMFIDKKDLIKVEHEFQKSTLVLSHSDYLSSKNEIYILKYDETLIEDYKVIIQTIDDHIIECKYISHPNKKAFMRKYNIKKVDYMYLFEESINFEVEEELEEDCG